ncbi:MAG TPA: PaaI family thioesterase, partial [Caulobacteraceae bacterium]
AELGARMADATPQAAALGLRFVSVEPGLAVIAVPHRADLVGDPETGVLAGGVVTTLLDHVCGLAVHSKLLSLGTAGAMAPLDLRIDYMRAAEPGRDVTARAHCYHVTHSIAFVRASAFDGDEADPVATVQATFALTPTVVAAA